MWIGSCDYWSWGVPLSATCKLENQERQWCTLVWVGKAKNLECWVQHQGKRDISVQAKGTLRPSLLFVPYGPLPGWERPTLQWVSFFPQSPESSSNLCQKHPHRHPRNTFHQPLGLDLFWSSWHMEINCHISNISEGTYLTNKCATLSHNFKNKHSWWWDLSTSQGFLAVEKKVLFPPGLQICGILQASAFFWGALLVCLGHTHLGVCFSSASFPGQLFVPLTVLMSTPRLGVCTRWSWARFPRPHAANWKWGEGMAFSWTGGGSLRWWDLGWGSKKETD